MALPLNRKVPTSDVTDSLKPTSTALGRRDAPETLWGSDYKRLQGKVQRPGSCLTHKLRARGMDFYRVKIEVIVENGNGNVSAMWDTRDYAVTQNARVSIRCSARCGGGEEAYKQGWCQLFEPVASIAGRVMQYEFSDESASHRRSGVELHGVPAMGHTSGILAFVGSPMTLEHHPWPCYLTRSTAVVSISWSTIRSPRSQDMTDGLGITSHRPKKRRRDLPTA